MLLLCLIMGILLRWFKRVPENAHTAINAVIIYISLPSLTLLQIHSVRFNANLPLAAFMPWLLFTVAALLFSTIGHWLKLPRTTVGALIVVGGLGNTSFIGLPMIDAFYGASGVPIGIVIDQLGSYLVLSTIGILIICIYADGALTAKDVVMRIVTFPPLIALVLAVFLLRVSYPAWLTGALTHLGGTLAPLALVSIGLQLRLDSLSGNQALLAAGVGYKLLIAPALIAVIYFIGLGLRGRTMNITLFEAGMAPQIGGSIVAIQFGLNGPLITLMVGVGTILSFLTLPTWWYFYH